MRLLFFVGATPGRRLERPIPALRDHSSDCAGSERPIAGFEGRRIETKRVREDKCLKIRLRELREHAPFGGASLALTRIWLGKLLIIVGPASNPRTDL